MSIERLDTNLDTREKIRLLNEMIMELSGKIDQAKFDKNELDNLFTQLAVSAFNLDRKYLRDVSLGHTYGTYSNWSHVKAETGYSIWKIAVSNYYQNALNNVYLDSVKLTNKGQASAETATSFDKVFYYNGSTYTDNSTEAATETGTEFTVLSDTNDYLYVGLSTTFAAIKFEMQTRGSGLTLLAEYWNGSAWTDLEFSGNSFTDNTSNLESDGLIEFDVPGNWATTTVNSVASKYWVRLSTTATPVTTPKAYYIVPGNSVVGLLALSSDQIIAGEWAWAYYSGSIYVTLRNAGATAHEGDYYITSTSTEVNKQNFFIANHHLTADYQDSTYAGV